MPSVIPSIREESYTGSILEELASRLSSNANKLSWYLDSNDYPQPSYGLDTPINVLPPGAPEAVQALRHELKQDALELFRLASGPSEYVAHISLNHQYTVCLRYLCQFDILSLVPQQGSVSMNNIAVVRNLSLPQLTSVIKMAVTSGLLTTPSPDRVAHSPASLLLASRPEFAAWATCVSKYMFDASAELDRAHERWGRSQEPQHSAFNVAFDANVSFGEYLAANPHVGRTMGMFVKATQMVEANDLRHLVNGFDWKSLGSATVVDVGATSMFPSLTLARAFPLLSFELQAQPRALSDIKASLETFGIDTKSRISISTQSMFAPQPKETNSANKQKKVFLLKHVLHNLPDPAAASILRNIGPVVSHDDRVVIMDLVLPEMGELHPYQEGMLRMRDMIQRELANGKTRDVDDWRRLIESSEPSFKLKRINKPSGSDLWVMEIAKES